MTSVIRSKFETPQVRPHRLLAVRLVLLREEVLLVGRDLRQVLLTGLNGRGYRSKSLALSQFVRTRSRGAGHALQASDVDAAAVGVGGLFHTVGSQHHLLVGCVRRFLVDAGECTADGLNHVSIFGFCHFLPAMLYLRPAWRGLG